ncbi:MAG: S8 family serine peptidase [Proteobacteria bacterium]|nr:S8 family serine peptidase [Pseudomonadota bacterium]MBU1546118.1 S8 family serine peptidase [Pseudomonadota bacterium]MBU2619291.1 S8 family serine peptidase [Pseudomonadota bacterium]
MKSHLIIKLHQPAATTDHIPHWVDAISTKSGGSRQLVPAIDAILAGKSIPVWVTREYPVAGQDWSTAEIKHGLNRIYRLVLQDDRQLPATLIRDINLLPEVNYARMGDIAVADLPQAHALTDSQASINSGTDRASREAIRLPEAHLSSQGDRRVIVAVLDTGVDVDHAELVHAYLPGKDFVDIIDGAERFLGDFLGYDNDPDDTLVGHGTHVAGIIAAAGTHMPRGVAPQCRILPVRVLGAMKRGDKPVGAGLVDNINVGLKWAIDQGAEVVNMSLGVRDIGGGLPYKEVIDYARTKNVTIVAASGNNGSEDLYYPGAYPYVVTVGALDQDKEHVAPFSTYGKQVDLVAPGTDVYSTFLNNGYAFSSGTSHAAPFVSGAIALLKSFARAKGHKLSDGRVKYIIKHTSDKVGSRYKHPKAGYGRLNIGDAMRLLRQKLN